MPARRSPCGHVPGFALHPERGLWLNGVIRLSLCDRLLPFAPKKDPLRRREIPRALLAHRADAHAADGVAPQKHERDLAQGAAVLRGMARARAALVLEEHHVQHPVQPVLNAPVPADQLPERLGVGLQRRDEAPALRLSIDAVHRADRLHHDEARKVLPLRAVREPRHVGRVPHPPDLHAAMPLVDVPGEGQPLRPRRDEVLHEHQDLGMHGGLVVLERQEIVGLRRTDRARNLLLASDRVDGDDRPLQRKRREQLRDRHDLVLFRVHAHLPQRGVRPVDPRRLDDGRTRALGAGPPDGLAVQGHADALQPPRRRALPQADAHAHDGGAHHRQDSPERVVAGDAVPQLQELPQARLVLPAVALHVAEPVAAGHVREHRDGEDVGEPVPPLAVDARVRHRLEHPEAPLQDAPLEPCGGGLRRPETFSEILD